MIALVLGAENGRPVARVAVFGCINFMALGVQSKICKFCCMPQIVGEKGSNFGHGLRLRW